MIFLSLSISINLVSVIRTLHLLNDVGGLGSWYVMPLSTIFQLYRGCDFFLVKTNIYIFRVYNIRIIATTKIGSHDMIQTDSSIIIFRNVCVLTSASMIFSFSSRGHDRQSSDQNFLHKAMIDNHRNKTPES